jgi:protein-S-isoprenylcysteine O-methyltransferase Ste14
MWVHVYSNECDMLPEKYEESEAPKADTIQAILALTFFTVWIVDSLWIKWTIGYAQYMPNIIRNGLFIALMLLGGYLTWKAHSQIFGTKRLEAELIDYGVFRISRHPMYLGILTMYFGLTLSSMSIAAFTLLIGIFYFYNYLAAYEETKLIEFFGDQYRDYMKKTRRWI